MYRVIRCFTDLQDNNYPYNAGDAFPRNGIDVSAERYAELAGSDNKQGTPLIEEIIEPVNEPVATVTAEEADEDEKPKRKKRRE